MFRKNQKHLQQKFFNPESNMNSTLRGFLKKHWTAYFYENIFLNIDEEVFAPLYSNNMSRPNVPVNILFSLEILKEMHNLTDLQLYENYLLNYAYQRAFGIQDINEYTFCIRTLYNFRATVAKYEYENNVDFFETVFKDHRDIIIKEMGIHTDLQRCDSTQIRANIKRMSRFTLFHKTLSNLLIEIKKYEPNCISKELHSLIETNEDGEYHRLRKHEIEEKLKYLSEQLYIHVTRWKDDKRINATSSYKNAKRLLAEQCIVKQEKVEILTPNEIKSGSMQNPSDPDATYRTKNEEKHFGYVCHSSETCSEKNAFQVITDVVVEKNIVDDSDLLEESLEDLKEETGLETMITDGGYPSEGVRETANKFDVNIVSTNVRGKSPEEGNLNSNDFEYDESGLIESCPMGERPTSQKLKDGDLVANFDFKICANCPLGKDCIALSKNQSRLVVDENRRWLDNREDNYYTPEYQELCNLRPAVEGLMEKLKPMWKNGRTRFRGLKKVRNRMVLRGIGLNFRRYSSWKLIQLYKNLSKSFSKFIFEISCHFRVENHFAFLR